LSDPILIKRTKDGDSRALETLCSRYQPRIERIARGELSDPRDAQDAAQDSLVKLCRRIGQFRGDAQFATWLHRLVVNTCRDTAARERIRRAEPLPDEMERGYSFDGDPERETLGAELRGELKRELAGLSPVHARVLVLKDALGFSFGEISELAEIPVGTAKCYAHRARTRLRERLTKEAAA
jgi:RNA polymerase sigma-70 factor (ECF subfamily)